jgi:hypothetical protein
LSPAVPLPHEHCTKAPLAGIADELVDLWPAGLGTTPAPVVDFSLMWYACASATIRSE